MRLQLKLLEDELDSVSRCSGELPDAVLTWRVCCRIVWTVEVVIFFLNSLISKLSIEGFKIKLHSLENDSYSWTCHKNEHKNQKPVDKVASDNRYSFLSRAFMFIV